jgi:tetratricopeptide (TPR) repeat protein
VHGRSRASASSPLRQGDHRGAIAHLERALAIEPVSAELEVAAADRLGRAYGIVGDFASAIALYERQLDRAAARDDELAVMRFATLLTNVHADSGNYGRAQELLGRAITIADKATDPLDRARLWWSQSRLHALKGEGELATRYGRMALETLEACEHTRYAAVAYLLLAQVENDRANAPAAISLLDRGQPTMVASGGVFATIGDRARAIELYELAAERLPVADRYRAEVFSSLAELLEAEGRKGDALTILKRALQPEPHVRNISTS